MGSAESGLRGRGERGEALVLLSECLFFSFLKGAYDMSLKNPFLCFLLCITVLCLAVPVVHTHLYRTGGIGAPLTSGRGEGC